MMEYINIAGDGSYTVNNTAEERESSPDDAEENSSDAFYHSTPDPADYHAMLRLLRLTRQPLN